MLALLLLHAAALSAQAGVVSAAAGEASHIIIPGAAFGQTATPTLWTPSPATTLIIGAPPALITPTVALIAAPAPAIIIAVRPMTEAEAQPEKMPSSGELKSLAESLAPSRDAKDAGPSVADQARSLEASFDGKMAPEALVWDDLSAHFAQGPLTPGLSVIERGARSLIARLMPETYRRVPALARYDQGEKPATGHLWTQEAGHVIELAPVRADSRGNVPSAFGATNETLIQQKMSHLMEFAHEYFHVLFDSAVRRKENHAMNSVYAAMTEGFAVSGEQILTERLLEQALTLGLGQREMMDLVAISAGRRRWLDLEDNHYSEGIIAWRKAYEEGGVKGLLSFLASLSARRMVAIPRSDSAYQLALGDPKLLSAYLGRDQSSADRRGLEAFAKAAKGEKLDEVETREAAAVVEKAGPEGWRRLFERTVLADKNLKQPEAAQDGNWWEKKAAPMTSPEPVFALARLSPAAGAAVAQHFATTIAVPGGAARLFEKSGPNEKLVAIVSGAESLPWDEAAHKTWNDGLNRWLMGKN